MSQPNSHFLTIKKAHAGQRGWIGPIYLSPDSEWADRLGPLRTRDGAEFSATRIVPYAYRHTYAQRHADAGVPIDVLAELLDHRNLNVTRQSGSAKTAAARRSTR